MIDLINSVILQSGPLDVYGLEKGAITDLQLSLPTLQYVYNTKVNMSVHFV